MSPCRDLCRLMKELAIYLKDPDAYAEKKRQEERRFRAERRKRLEEQYGNLDTLFAHRPEQQVFSTFTAALDAIAGSLDEDDPVQLAAIIPDFGRRLEDGSASRPEYEVHFLHVFGQLRSIHREQDLRACLRDVEFPENEDVLRLGASHFALRGINLAFERRHWGWVLKDVYQTR